MTAEATIFSERNYFPSLPAKLPRRLNPRALVRALKNARSTTGESGNISLKGFIAVIPEIIRPKFRRLINNTGLSGL